MSRTLSRALRTRLVRAGGAVTTALVVATCGGDSPTAVANVLAFAVQPATTVAGAPIPDIRVEIRNSSGSIATSFGGSVTLAITTGTGGGATLGGDASVTAINGVATFRNLSITKSGTGYTLTASAATLAAVNSSTFDITAGAMNSLVFTVQPGNATAGAAIPAVQVTARDAYSNVATGFNGNVTIAIGTNPGGGSLSGGMSVNAAAGVANFPGLIIDKSGTGYTLTASAAGSAIVSTTSAPFVVNAGAARTLLFTTQPSNATAGADIPAVVVTAVDAHGNVATGFASAVTLAIGANPVGGNLDGTTTVGAGSGLATFANVRINRAGNGYTLTASATGLDGATSTSFDIAAGVTAQLVFTTQPSTVTAGAVIAPPIVVAAQDAAGNLTPSFAGSVTVTIANNAGDGMLTGTLTAPAAGGVATFADLRIDSAGTGYTLAAATGGLTADTSTAFAVVAGPATTLAFSVEPTNAVAGAAISPAVKVAARDALGNVDLTYTGEVTVALTGGPAGATLGGDGTVAAVAGVAMFADLTIDSAGTGYTLTAAAAGLTDDVSAAFAITAGPPASIAFTVEPTDAVAGVAISPAVEVTARDAQGNVATGFTGDVMLAITTGTGTAGATLLGTTTVPAGAGVATFADLSIDSAGTGYTLAATVAGVPGATSAAFAITAGAATQLLFTVDPTDAIAGAAISPAVVVTARDAVGNVDPTFTGEVTLALGGGTAGATLGGDVTVSALAGVATFADVSIDSAGTGYTLTATGTGLTDGASAAFAITAGAATRLVFMVPPSTTVAGATMTPAVRVAAQDALGNVDLTYVGEMTLALAGGPAGTTLGGDLTVAAVAGVATFGDLSIDSAATGYTLTATSGALTAGLSAAFDIIAGPPATIAFTVEPSSTAAGVAISPAVVVTVRDALGNVATGFAGDVALAITGGTGKAGAVLLGAPTLPAVAGVATFANLSIDSAGIGYTLTVTSGAMTPDVSAPFDVTPGAASVLVFTTSPGTTVVGAQLRPAPRVSVRDALGNDVPTYVGNVTVTIGANPGNATLTGPNTQATIDGVATLSSLRIGSVGSGYTLVANAPGLTQGVSAPFNVVASTAVRLTFAAQPTSAVAGAALPAVQVEALDLSGQTVTSFTGNVTVTLAANPGGGTLSGPTTVSAVAGVATFGGLSIDRPATGYRLAVTSTGLTADTSTSFTIEPAAAHHLEFTLQPSAATVAQAISPAVEVTVRDGLGNPVTNFVGTVTVALASNPGGAVLSGTTTATVVAGVASFGNLIVGASGNGYTLAATTGSVISDTSNAFNVSASPVNRLVFTTQPTETVAGQAIGPVRVTVQNPGGATVAFNGPVTVAIAAGTGTPGAVLQGTTTVVATNGVATFSGLSIVLRGSNYRLSATAAGVSGATSIQFDIRAAAPFRLTFSNEPAEAGAGEVLDTVQVVARDQFGNRVFTFADPVVIAIGDNPGSSVLSGTTTVAPVGGVASFANLRLDRPAKDYTLTATSGALVSATSDPFNIVAGAATRLVFTVQPDDVTRAAAISPAVRVMALDSLGNNATGFSGSVTVALDANPSGGALFGITTVLAAGGEAVFPGLNIDKVGSGYTLAATAAGLTGTVSGPFDVTAGSGNQLVFITEPTSTTAGAAITPPVQVAVLDAQGAVNTAFSAAVTLVIIDNPGGGTLSGEAVVNVVSGVATFPGLSINRPGSGYTLRAIAAGALNRTSQPFSIVPGAATELIFTVQPVTTVAGDAITPSVRVTARDALGNTATSFTGNVTMVIPVGSNPGGGALAGATDVAAVAGVATFANLSIDKAGAGYRLAASALGLTGVTSNTFTITPAAASQLAFTVQPVNTVAGATLADVVVTARDQFGNTATAFTGSVALDIGTNPPGTGVLDGTTSVPAIAGVATFTGLDIDEAGAGYTLTADATGLTGATSTPFTVSAGSAAQLTFTVEPTDAMAGVAITPAIQVTARDAQGNVDPTFTGAVTVAITGSTGTTGAALAGTTTLAAVAGVATFADLAIDSAGTGYTLTASAASLTDAVSAAFDITAGGATTIGFTVDPTDATAGAAINPAVVVTLRDGQGNVASGFTGDVTLAITAASGTTGAALSGTTTLAAIAGVASFGDLAIDSAGTGYTLTATAAGLDVVSAAFDITAGAAAAIAFTVEPTDATAGVAITPAVVVTVRDAQGNVATGFTDDVTIAIATNAGSGTLSGDATVAAIAGVATFTDLSIDKAGAGYTLTATAAGLDVVSAAFDITAGVAATLEFSVEPVTTIAGDAITPAIQVTARDAQGNVAPSFTGDVTIAIANNAGSGTLSGDATVAAIAGVATFTDLSIDKAGLGYTLSASADGPAGATSADFDITAGAVSASQSTMSANPTTIAVSEPSIITVTARDQFGNVISGATVVLDATGTGNIFTQPGATDAFGVATGTFAATDPGGRVVTATINGVLINQTATVTVTLTP